MALCRTASADRTSPVATAEAVIDTINQQHINLQSQKLSTN
jgi:hypothetical protein